MGRRIAMVGIWVALTLGAHAFPAMAQQAGRKFGPGDERGMISAAFLRQSCEGVGGKPVDMKRAVCGGYVRGFLEGMRAQSLATRTPEPYCAAPETPITAFAQSFNRWYEAHKPPTNELAAVSFGKALVENYPCMGTAP